MFGDIKTKKDRMELGEGFELEGSSEESFTHALLTVILGIALLAFVYFLCQL